MTRALTADATIQWYPGHMVRAMRRVAEDLRVADVVIEVVDARVPRSGANPSLGKLAAHKKRLVVLAREDLADPVATAAWLAALRAPGLPPAVAVDAKSPGGASRLREAVAALSPRGIARALVVGIPNAGKSTVINALVGRKVARAEDRAGVTRTPQWFRVSPTLEVMDTAGILVPKIDSVSAQWKLALVGAVPHARFDPEDVATHFATWAAARGSEVPNLDTFAQRRGFVGRGTMPDMHNAAWAFVKAFGEGRFGRITLEDPA